MGGVRQETRKSSMIILLDCIFEIIDEPFRSLSLTSAFQSSPQQDAIYGFGSTSHFLFFRINDRYVATSENRAYGLVWAALAAMQS
jgi:hypothetical protein